MFFVMVVILVLFDLFVLVFGALVYLAQCVVDVVVFLQILLGFVLAVFVPIHVFTFVVFVLSVLRIVFVLNMFFLVVFFVFVLVYLFLKIGAFLLEQPMCIFELTVILNYSDFLFVYFFH